MTSLIEQTSIPESPLYHPKEGHQPHSYKRAIDVNRRSHGGTTCEPPPELLINAIRAGRLTRIGFALPIRRSIGVEPHSNASQSTLESGCSIKGDRTSRDEPLVFSSTAFMSALLSTVFPSLVDMPEALYQWFGFARTVLEIDRVHGWQIAASYISQVIPERIGVGGADLATLDEGILSNAKATLQSSRNSGPVQQSHNQPQRGQSLTSNSGGAGSVNKDCWDWNNKPQGCTRPVCTHQHICPNRRKHSPCPGDGHVGRLCPKLQPGQSPVSAKSAAAKKP